MENTTLSKKRSFLNILVEMLILETFFIAVSVEKLLNYILIKMMKVQVKRLFHGYASLRDYQVGQAMEDKDDLEIKLMGTEETMTISYKELHKGKINPMKFKSIHDNFTYQLVDYKFIPDKNRQMKLLK